MHDTPSFQTLLMPPRAETYRGAGRKVPQNFRLEGRPMHPSSYISRTTGIGCEEMYVPTKWRSSIGIFGCWNRRFWPFWVKKEKKSKIDKAQRMTRKISEIFRREIEIFPKKGHSEICYNKFCSSPQTQCQVSAHECQCYDYKTVQVLNETYQML